MCTGKFGEQFAAWLMINGVQEDWGLDRSYYYCGDLHMNSKMIDWITLYMAGGKPNKLERLQIEICGAQESNLGKISLKYWFKGKKIVQITSEDQDGERDVRDVTHDPIVAAFTELLWREFEGTGACLGMMRLGN